jgi:two-component system NarL family sensor kinase
VDELMDMARKRKSLGETIAAVRLDHIGRIVDATSEAATMLGFTPEELHGLTLNDLAADRWGAMADAATARVLIGDRRPFQLLLRGRSGRRTLVQMASRRVEQSDKPSYVLAWSERPLESTDMNAPELRQLANGLLRRRETERSRVATELHNEVASLILVSKFMIEQAIRQISDGERTDGVDLLNDAVGRLREAFDEIRRISTELRPSLLDDLGLLPTLEWLCRTFEHACRSIRIERRIAVAELDVPENLKLVIFRIVEELLRNVARHANAKHVRIELVRDADELRLLVEDDGDGFDAALHCHGVQHTRGIGLRSIREGLQASGGRFALDSTPNKGARIGARWALSPRVPN